MIGLFYIPYIDYIMGAFNSKLPCPKFCANMHGVLHAQFVRQELCTKPVHPFAWNSCAGLRIQHRRVVASKIGVDSHRSQQPRIAI